MNSQILTEEEIESVWESMDGGPSAWMRNFGYSQFAKKIEEKLLAKLVPIDFNEQVKLVEDANRYRWLRDSPIGDQPELMHGSVWVVRYSHPSNTMPTLESAGKDGQLNYHVDAAMGKFRVKEPKVTQ
jgi:hypothetical protein